MQSKVLLKSVSKALHEPRVYPDFVSTFHVLLACSIVY